MRKQATASRFGLKGRLLVEFVTNEIVACQKQQRLLTPFREFLSKAERQHATRCSRILVVPGKGTWRVCGLPSEYISYGCQGPGIATLCDLCFAAHAASEAPTDPPT